MDNALAQPLILGAILAVFAVVLDRRDRSRYIELKTGIDRLETSLRSEIASLRTEVAFEISSLRSEFTAEIGAVRSDLVQVALAVGARPRPQTG